MNAILTRNLRRKLTANALLALTLTFPATSFAASGTWTQAASGGLWSDTANWSGGIVADGSGFSGIFNTIDITADNTVHMDAAHTLTSLTFGDTDTGTAAGWTLDNNGTAGNILTLAGTTPSITVGALGAGKSVTISAVLAGSTAWSKLGAGALTLSGANTFTGNWAVNAGSLNYDGSLAAGTQLAVNSSGANSIVNIGSGANLTFNNANMLVGNNATAGTGGAVFQSGGTVTGVNQLQIGAVTGGSYGYYKLSGSAALTIKELDCGGFNGAPTGVFDITGGTLTDSDWLIIARGSGGSSLLNLTGGTVNFTGTFADRLIMNYNANASQSAVINVANANFNALNATAGILNLMRSGSAGQFGAVNLLSGGVVQVQGIRAGNTTGTSHFNFNGGTLKASTANATFLDSSLSLGNVYSGGGTIDNNGVNVTIAKALTAPAGNGLNGAVTLVSGGSGYIGAPAVTFSGGGGSGATAYATVSGGAVTGVIITSPGVNYSSTPSIVFTGGGGTGASATAPTPTANTSGGMTFQGSGSTTLAGANTYGGDTIINGGTLKVGSALLHLSFDNVSGSTVFNEGSGGSALNGTLNGTATIVSGGMFGNCLQISGANAAAASCRVASSVVPLNVGAGNNWTVAMWVKSSTAGGCYAYQGDGGWASGNTTFYMNQGNGTLNASSTKAGGVRHGQGWVAGTTAVNNGAWHHVVLTCNGTTKTAYVDGNVDTLTVNSWNGNGNGGQFWIGGAGNTGDGTANLNGQVDEVYVFRRTLSQAEVQSLYNNNNNTVSETILPPNTTVTVAASATLDVSSSATFILAANQNLMGSGVVTGAVTTASTSKIYAGTDGTVSTLSFSNNLTMTSGSSFSLDVNNASHLSGNDSLVVSGTLTLNANTLNIRPASASALDNGGDYVLVTANSISGTPNGTINWVGNTPSNAGNYTAIKDGNTIVLRYSAANPPVITSATASPATLTHGQSTLITAAVTPGDAALTSVTISGSALTGAVTLNSDGAGNYTNTATISPSTAAGSHTLTVLAADANSLVASSNITVTVVVQDEIWTGGGGDSKWTTGGNWTSGLPPGTGDSIFFDGSAQLINNLDASLSVALLTFNSGAGSFTITNSANTLTLTGGLTNNSANPQTLDVPVALSGLQTISAASGDITISQAVSGSGSSLTKVGPGTLALSGVNTYSGATTIGNGLLTIGGAGVLGGGGYSENITDNGALNVASSASQTWSGIISGTGPLTNSGSGTLTLSGANTYSGGTTINAGTVDIQNNAALGTGTATLAGGTIQASGAADRTVANNIVAQTGTTSTLATSGRNLTINGNISGSGDINRSAPSSATTVALGGDNSGFTGTFTQANSGNAVLRFVTTANSGSAAARWAFQNPTAGRTTLDFVGDGTIAFGSMTGSGHIQANASGTKTISAGALGLTDTFSGILAANGANIVAFTKVGSGTMTLSGANTYTGATTVSNGTLLVNSPGSLGNTAVAVKTGATLGGNGTLGGAVTVEAGGALSPSGTFPATLTVNNTLALAGTSSFRINATQSDKVSGVTTFTSGGTLNVTLDSGSLAGGESYTLVQATTYGGTAPAAGTLPTLGSGLNWYLGKMPVDGTISVNRAPTASDLVTSVESGRSVSIVVIGGKHAPTDADAGDTANLQISGVGGTPTLGSASTDGTSVTYTSGGSTGSDSFTYTVSDGRGGTVTKTVTVTVTGGNGANIISLTGTVPNITVNFAGMPSSTYAIERATSPSGPWGEIAGSVITGANGLGSYLDDEAPSPTGYYRTRYVSTP